MRVVDNNQESNSDVVEDKPEHVVLDEEGVTHGLQDKILHEGLGLIIISLELAHHIDKDASIKHGMAVDGGDNVGYALEGEGVQLLHNLHSSLHLLTLEAEETLFGIVELSQLTPRGGVVEHGIILFSERFTDLIEIRIQGHFT